MESEIIYSKAYEAVTKLLKSNYTSGKLVIDYDVLDERTAAMIRQSLDSTLRKRKAELWNVIVGAK